MIYSYLNPRLLQWIPRVPELFAQKWYYQIKRPVAFAATETNRINREAWCIMILSIVALVPILWLIVALTLLKMPGHKACLSALAITIILALTLWHLPAVDCATSAAEGFATALWPIILVILAAIFTYNLALKTGAMEVIKKTLTGVSADKRVLILLIGW